MCIQLMEFRYNSFHRNVPKNGCTNNIFLVQARDLKFQYVVVDSIPHQPQNFISINVQKIYMDQICAPKKICTQTSVIVPLLREKINEE